MASARRWPWPRTVSEVAAERVGEVTKMRLSADVGGNLPLWSWTTTCPRYRRATIAHAGRGRHCEVTRNHSTLGGISR